MIEPPMRANILCGTSICASLTVGLLPYPVFLMAKFPLRLAPGRRTIGYKNQRAVGRKNIAAQLSAGRFGARKARLSARIR